MSADALAACPFSIAQEYASEFFRRAQAGDGDAQIRAPLPFFPAFVRRRVTLKFGVHSDGSEPGRPHDEIRLRWNSGTALLPNFHGTVRLRIAGAATRVLVDGAYQAPGGSIGRVFDSLIGARIARAGVDDLANRVAAYLEERERSWRANIAVPARGTGPK